MASMTLLMQAQRKNKMFTALVLVSLLALGIAVKPRHMRVATMKVAADKKAFEESKAAAEAAAGAEAAAAAEAEAANDAEAATKIEAAATAAAEAKAGAEVEAEAEATPLAGDHQHTVDSVNSVGLEKDTVEDFAQDEDLRNATMPPADMQTAALIETEDKAELADSSLVWCDTVLEDAKEYVKLKDGEDLDNFSPGYTLGYKNEVKSQASQAVERTPALCGADWPLITYNVLAYVKDVRGQELKDFGPPGWTLGFQVETRRQAFQKLIACNLLSADWQQIKKRMRVAAKAHWNKDWDELRWSDDIRRFAFTKVTGCRA